MIKNIFILALAALAVADKTCYYPDGSTAVDDVPCFSGSQSSPCCDQNAICLTNGYCLDVAQPFVLSRGSCTDKSWAEDSGCSDPCSGLPTIRGGGCSLPLYSYDGSTAKYCANSIIKNDTGLACAAGDPIPIANGDVITNKALLASASCALDRVAATGKNPTPSSSSSVNSTAGSSNDDSKNVAIGAGVGVPLGVLLLAALGWAFFERKKRMNLLNNMSMGQQPIQPIQPIPAHAQPYPYGMQPIVKPGPMPQELAGNH